RAATPCLCHGDEARSGAGFVRSNCRNAGLDWLIAFHRRTVIWNFAHQCDYVRRRWHWFGFRRIAGLLFTRQARHESESAGSTEIRVIALVRRPPACFLRQKETDQRARSLMKQPGRLRTQREGAWIHYSKTSATRFAAFSRGRVSPRW